MHALDCALQGCMLQSLAGLRGCVRQAFVCNASSQPKLEEDCVKYVDEDYLHAEHMYSIDQVSCALPVCMMDDINTKLLIS